ncbi:MAG: hypothetical protein J0L97_08955 [Alphaproteobacteria bacterium]|nr:hypothetical protein [Alphaproteobacteria bacterium]
MSSGYKETIFLGNSATGPNPATSVMPLTVEACLEEMAVLYALGVRYAHYHARNPATSEQSENLIWYNDLALALAERYPEVVTSFGSSRQGPELRAAMQYTEVLVEAVRLLSGKHEMVFWNAMIAGFALASEGKFQEFFPRLEISHPEVIEALRALPVTHISASLNVLLGREETPAPPPWESLGLMMQILNRAATKPDIFERYLETRGELARAGQFMLAMKRCGAPDYGTWVAAPDIILTGDALEVDENKRRRDGVLDPHALAAHVEVVAEVMAHLHIGHEIEVTTFPGGLNVLKYLGDSRRSGVRLQEPVNVVVLFGFSDELRIPESYEDFQAAILRVREAMPEGMDFRITVGAVVRKHEAHRQRPLDPEVSGSPVLDDVQRVCDYCLREDSGVDMFRTGVEDSPYRLIAGVVREVSNEENVRMALEIMSRRGVAPETDHEKIASAFEKPVPSPWQDMISEIGALGPDIRQ